MSRLASKISTDFPGVNGNSINWMKHYLNGGDDVGASWNGVCDSVSGYTYKYSNQFEYDFKYSDLSNPNLFLHYFVVSGSTGNSGSDFKQSEITNISLGTTGVIPEVTGGGDPSYDVTVARFGFPDLPGGLFITMTNGVFKYTMAAPMCSDNPATVVNSTRDQLTSTIFIPILDPNWDPDIIDPDLRFISIPSGGVPNGLRKLVVPVKRGFNEELTAYRMAGASMTITVPASVLHKNGSFVACSATVPFNAGENENLGGWSNPAQTDNINYQGCIQLFDAPIGYSNITSVKTYHKYSIDDGVYTVLHNTQGSFLFHNIESSMYTIVGSAISTLNGVSQTYEVGNTNYAVPISLYISDFDGDLGHLIPIVYMRSNPLHLKYYNTVKFPIYNIPRTPLTEWNASFVSPSMTDQSNSLVLTIKLDSYVECYVAAKSTLKPSVTMTSAYYPRLLEYLSGFYHEYDGIYPSSWNDGKKIWKFFKDFLMSDKLAKAMSTVSPSAGQIVSLVQSTVQRIANKKNDRKDQKLSDKEKSAVKDIVKKEIAKRK